MPNAINDVTVVELFCGIGGLSHGFHKEGFRVAAGIDSDPSCKYAFETNNESTFIDKPIEDVKPGEISKLLGKAKTRVLIGCAPCQPFSAYNRKKRETDKWKLLRNFSKLISEIEPEIVSMENVPQLRKHPVYDEFVGVLEDLHYSVSAYSVYCPDYGVPQRRRRLVLIASKYGKVPLIPKTHLSADYVKVRDVISKLRPLAAGETDPKDPMHKCRKLSPLNLERIRNTPEGGAWQAWDASLRPKCLRKKILEQLSVRSDCLL